MSPLCGQDTGAAGQSHPLPPDPTVPLAQGAAHCGQRAVTQASCLGRSLYLNITVDSGQARSALPGRH